MDSPAAATLGVLGKETTCARPGHIEGTCSYNSAGNDENDREPNAKVNMLPGEERLVGKTCGAVRQQPQ